MHQMIELHPRPDALDVLGLPAIPYPVALPVFQAAVANDGELPLAEMLHGLQLRAAHGPDWQRLEPAMARLSELIAGDDHRASLVVSGADWGLEIGPIAATVDCVVLRRGESLLAALRGRGDGGLRLAAYRPLDGSAIALLLDLAAHREGTGAGARDAWQGACAAAACASRHTPDDDLTPWLQRLPDGLRAEQPAPGNPLPGAPALRRPACVAAELSTWDGLRARA